LVFVIGAEPFEPGERPDGNFIEGGNTGRRSFEPAAKRPSVQPPAEWRSAPYNGISGVIKQKDACAGRCGMIVSATIIASRTLQKASQTRSMDKAAVP
jgi:hypothetical protein